MSPAEHSIRGHQAAQVRAQAALARQDELYSPGSRVIARSCAAVATGAPLQDPMELHGSTKDNLVAALRSARRLRGRPVYSDTLSHWTNLVHYARRELATAASPAPTGFEQLVVDLEGELAQRPL